MPSVRPLVGFLQIGLIHGDGELSRTSSPPSKGIYPYGVLWITRRNLWRTPPCCGKRGLLDLPSSNNPVVEGEEMLAEGAKEKIKASKSKHITIDELLESKQEVSKIKIIV